MKINLILYLITIAYLYFVEVSGRSIHVDSDVLSRIEVREDKSLNRDQEFGGKKSWKKFKPFLRREVQRIRNVNGKEAIKVKPVLQENTPVIHSINKEGFIENLNVDKKENMSLKSEQEIINNIIASDLAIKNQTFESGQFISNVTDAKMLTLDPTSTTRDFPYNITPDILTQSGDLIVFLALNDNGSNMSVESEDNSLLNEGTTLALKEIPSTGKELLNAFEIKQNFIQTELPTLEKNIKDENNFSDLTNEDYFIVSNFTFNHNRENELEEISTTKGKSILSDNAEISTNRYEIQNIGLDFKNSYEDEKVAEIFNADQITEELKDQGNKFGSVESEKISFLNRETTVALQEIPSTENDFLTNFETKQNLIQTEPTLQIRQNDDRTFTDLTDEDHFNVSTFTFNRSQENDLQTIATTKHDSIISHTTGISPDRFETVDSLLNSFKDVKPAESSNIGPELPKCPDPGLCIFWFLAQDLCAKDSHCHGALICCMWGCSKICVDGENVLS